MGSMPAFLSQYQQDAVSGGGTMPNPAEMNAAIRAETGKEKDKGTNYTTLRLDDDDGLESIVPKNLAPQRAREHHCSRMGTR